MFKDQDFHKIPNHQYTMSLPSKPQDILNQEDDNRYFREFDQITSPLLDWNAYIKSRTEVPTENSDAINNLKRNNVEKLVNKYPNNVFERPMTKFNKNGQIKDRLNKNLKPEQSKRGIALLNLALSLTSPPKYYHIE